MKTIREEKLGKSSVIRLLSVGEEYACIVIQNSKIAQRVEGGDPEELWQQCIEAVATNSPDYFGMEGAKKRFLRIFPDGFSTQSYKDSERSYKLEAHSELLRQLPLDRVGSEISTGAVAKSIYFMTNLLSPFEKMRVKDILTSSQGDDFVHAAAEFSVSNQASDLHALKKILEPFDAAKWTVATYLPFFWRPDRNMFLKPEVTKKFADRIGHRFSDRYEASLEIGVYESLMDLTSLVRENIADLEPADNIDIQSFIWVVGEYTSQDEAAMRKESNVLEGQSDS